VMPFWPGFGPWFEPAGVAGLTLPDSVILNADCIRYYRITVLPYYGITVIRYESGRVKPATGIKGRNSDLLPGPVSVWSKTSP